MNLYLTGKEITYIPTKEHIKETFTTVLDEVVHILSTVPRLYEKFALPAGGLKKFYEVIQADQDCNKLQALIGDGTVIQFHKKNVYFKLMLFLRNCCTVIY